MKTHSQSKAAASFLIHQNVSPKCFNCSNIIKNTQPWLLHCVHSVLTWVVRKFQRGRVVSNRILCGALTGNDDRNIWPRLATRQNIFWKKWKQSGNYVSNVVAYAYDVSSCWLKMHRYVYVLYCFILLSTYVWIVVVAPPLPLRSQDGDSWVWKVSSVPHSTIRPFWVQHPGTLSALHFAVLPSVNALMHSK